jgi:hypothetical protein
MNEVKALAAGNPLLLLDKADAELTRLDRLERAHGQGLGRLHAQVGQLVEQDARVDAPRRPCTSQRSCRATTRPGRPRPVGHELHGTPGNVFVLETMVHETLWSPERSRRSRL